MSIQASGHSAGPAGRRLRGLASQVERMVLPAISRSRGGAVQMLPERDIRSSTAITTPRGPRARLASSRRSDVPGAEASNRSGKTPSRRAMLEQFSDVPRSRSRDQKNASAVPPGGPSRAASPPGRVPSGSGLHSSRGRATARPTRRLALTPGPVRHHAPERRIPSRSGPFRPLPHGNGKDRRGAYTDLRTPFPRPLRIFNVTIPTILLG